MRPDEQEVPMGFGWKPDWTSRTISGLRLDRILVVPVYSFEASANIRFDPWKITLDFHCTPIGSTPCFRNAQQVFAVYVVRCLLFV